MALKVCDDKALGEKKGGLSTTPQGALSSTSGGEPSTIWGPIHFIEAPREEGRSTSTRRYICKWRANRVNAIENRELVDIGLLASYGKKGDFRLYLATEKRENRKSMILLANARLRLETPLALKTTRRVIQPVA
jgi:hypothetical protein